MDEPIASLMKSIRELRTAPDVNLELDTDIGDLPSRVEAEALYADLFGFDCPPSMRSGLQLPDAVEIRWQHGETIAGEMRIANPIVAMHRQLDESLLDWTVDGRKLANMRVVDEVLVKAGPLYTLFEVGSRGPSEQLFLFDTRRLRSLALDYAGYLDAAGTSKSIVYWQYLYCDMLLTPAEAKRLAEAIDFLAKFAPQRPLDGLRQRLGERSGK
jgi:hypothetical protein